VYTLSKIGFIHCNLSSKKIFCQIDKLGCLRYIISDYSDSLMLQKEPDGAFSVKFVRDDIDGNLSAMTKKYDVTSPNPYVVNNYRNSPWVLTSMDDMDDVNENRYIDKLLFLCDAYAIATDIINIARINHDKHKIYTYDKSTIITGHVNFIGHTLARIHHPSDPVLRRATNLQQYTDALQWDISVTDHEDIDETYMCIKPINNEFSHRLYELDNDTVLQIISTYVSFIFDNNFYNMPTEVNQHINECYDKVIGKLSNTISTMLTNSAEFELRQQFASIINQNMECVHHPSVNFKAGVDIVHTAVEYEQLIAT
jgi:hypothetical protein